MRGKDGQRIITEDDIQLLDGSSSLSERFSEQQLKINLLESNLKWIYKYGGVGGKGGGGSTTTAFSIYATLNTILLKDQTIVLDGQGVYPLSIKINNPNGALFNVRYSYTTLSNNGAEVDQSQTLILSIENNYRLDTNITLNNNSTLLIEVSDGNSTLQTQCTYITSPYQFSLTLVDKDDTVYSSDEIFVNTAKKRSIVAKLIYNVYIDAAITGTYDFDGEAQAFEITKKDGYLTFDIPEEYYQESKAGVYSSVVNMLIAPTNQEPVLQQVTKTFNIIPDDLYILVSPLNGIFYKQQQTDPYQYQAGYIGFNYRIYEGANQNRDYTVTILVDDNDAERNWVKEREMSSHQVYINTQGEHRIKISTKTYSYTYYVYVQEPTDKLSWFADESNWTQHYYRAGEVSDRFSSLKGQDCISQTVNSTQKEFSQLIGEDTTGNAMNTHIAIGIQYSEINSTEDPIFRIINNNGVAIFALYPLKVYFGSDTTMYLEESSDIQKNKTEQYQLVLIYSQAIKELDNAFYYQTSVYLNGTLEVTFNSINKYALDARTILVFPVNCFINLLEVDYKSQSFTMDNDIPPSNCDEEVFRYFLNYKNAILHDKDYVSKNKDILSYLNNFTVDVHGRVTTTEDNVSNIAKNSEVPTLVMTYQLSDSEEVSDFLSYMDTSFDENQSIKTFDVSVSWSSGNAEPKPITFPSEMQGALFQTSFQGSSTRTLKAKNWWLGLTTTSETASGDTYLFSPNFNDLNTSTFLPEKRFNLRADVVDSSHSNNTACGKFVNAVCKKFVDNPNQPYNDYVKNCLDGFPVLLYLNLVKKDNVTGNIDSTYYYLGIHNFNLGREAYYNLGYMDLSVFKNKLTNAPKQGFTFCSISENDYSIKPGVAVAEILGNSSYFDFSQYDPSILFEQESSAGSNADSTYMFGDIVVGSNSTLALVKNSITKLVESVAKSGGYIFDMLKKNFGSYSDGYNKTMPNDGTSSYNQVPDYHTLYKRTISTTGNVYLEIGKISGKSEDLQKLIIPDTSSENAEPNGLDYRSLSEYYTILMVLGLVDNIVKNLNIKTWNNSPNGTATWVPAFYDMDSCLGKNNAGSFTKYFAFSDYWRSNTTTNNGEDYPTGVTMFRDFSFPNDSDGYDMPSSYLFAIAKYARLFIGENDENLEYTANYPQELYAKWRNPTQGKDGLGILKNADYFVDTFFASNLKKINPVLISYNYRTKYLNLNSSTNTWVTLDYQKFHGTCINQVRNWLNGRLHILDAYFNINQRMVLPIQYLDTTDNKWKEVKIGNSNVNDLTYHSNYNLNNNEDIVILHDIFSTGQLWLTNTAAYLSFKCPEYSPLQITIANSSANYLVGGNRRQNVYFNTIGLQTVLLGGSAAWTELSNINWVNTSGASSTSSQAFYISSKKLSNVNGTSGSFNGITLLTPNVKTISLTSSGYKGQLAMSNSNGVNYPNLQTLNIAGSGLGVDLNALYITSLNISRVNTLSDISIKGCTSILNFSYGNITAPSLTLNPIPKDTISLNGSKINSISLTDGKTAEIKNDSAVASINITNVLRVVISNCPNLKSITVSGSVKYLSVTSCANLNLSINHSTAGEVHLNSLTSLNTVSFRNCNNLKNIYLPDNCQVEDYGFLNVYTLESLTGNNIGITGVHTFNNCRKFALKQSSGEYCDIHVTGNSLWGCFKLDLYSYIGSLTRDDILHFIDNAVSDDNTISNLYLMCYNQTKISYTLLDYKNLVNYINLTKFKNVNNASYAFAGCGITFLHKGMWNLGSKADAVNMNSFSTPYLGDNADAVMYTTVDLLSNIVSKLYYFNSDYNNYYLDYVFVDSDGNEITDTIMLKDFFNPGGVAPSRLYCLSRFLTSLTQKVDFTDMFTSKWTSLELINVFYWKTGCNYIGADKLFYNLPKLNLISNSLLTSSDTTRYDLFTLLNWNRFLDNGGLFSISNDSYAKGQMRIYKTITFEDYKNLCNLLVLSKITDISYIFCNCNITGYTDETFVFGNSSKSNSTIKSIRYLYANCKLYFDDGKTELYINLSPTFFNNLTAITDVRYAFYNCSFSSFVPFNFFGKRRKIVTSVWVKTDEGKEEYSTAQYVQYTYNKDIYNYDSIFADCKWAGNTYFTLDSSLTIEDLENHILLDGVYYKTYYIQSTSIDSDGTEITVYEKKTIKESPEIEELKDINGYSYPNSVILYPLGSYTNPTAGIAVNHLCIPPDFFYGTSNTVTGDNNVNYIDYSRAFASTTPITGVLPKQVFTVKTGMAANTFFNAIIVPLLVKQIKDGDNTVNIYSQFPENYTENTSLDYAFSCQPIIPLDNVNSKNYVVTLLSTSIPQNTTSMLYAFYYTVSNWFYRGQNITVDYSHYGIIGTLTANGITFGLDTTYFKNLYLDNLYYTKSLTVCEGNLFDTNFDVKKANRQTLGTYNVVIYNPGNQISALVKLPDSTVELNNFAKPYDYNGFNQLKSNQVSESSRIYYTNAGFNIA